MASTGSDAGRRPVLPMPSNPMRLRHAPELDPRVAFLDRYHPVGMRSRSSSRQFAPDAGVGGFSAAQDAGGRDAALFSDVRCSASAMPGRRRIVHSRPADLQQDGLREPWHRLETALTYCGRYFWTLRARFSLQGARV